MLNFNSIFKRSPDESKGGKNKKEEIPKLGGYSELIENQPDFWYAFIDSKNQFMLVIFAINSGKTIEEIRELSKNHHYLHFKDYIKGNKQFISDNLEYNDNYKYNDIINSHDVLIDEIKEFNFHSIKDLKNFLKQVDDLFKVRNLEK